MTLLLLLAASFLLAACGRSGPPYSPREALETFRLDPGYRIELFASEPDLADPVDMEFDEHGRLYVVENPGYPLNPEGKVGRVKLLEDTNGDGRPDRTTLFADQLVLPTGVMRWKKGILVTDPPDVLYFEDTNGDGRADVRRVVLTGFAFTNPQHTVNNPVYGLDNWIYLAHEGSTTAVIYADKFGDRGTEIHFPDRPGGPRLKVERRSLRFRPDTYELEALAGSTQFGYAIDDWGRHFTHNNSNHLRHEVIAARYLRRNPDLLIPIATHDISDHGSNAAVFPITRRPQYQMLTESGEFTSACGLTVLWGGSFVAEPTHNLVHRDLWSPHGSTFVARRDRPGVEFLASTDPWFRPVNFYAGPDGALYLVDYYRQVIEHPEWTSEQVAKSKDLYNGSDRGRIYRIVPASSPPPPSTRIRMGDAPDDELVRHLDSPNIWQRRTAQRLLVDRRSDSARPLLARLFDSSASPLGRLHALWTLDGLGSLDAALIEKALGDRDPGVRENAIILAEPRLAAAAALAKKLLPMVDDPDGRVRFQLLCTLGNLATPAARAAQEKLLDRDIDDHWVQVAALSAGSDRAPALFDRARARLGLKTDGGATFFRQAAAVIGARRKADEIRRVVQSHGWWREAALQGLGQGLRGRGAPAAVVPLLFPLFDDSDPAVRRVALALLGPESGSLPSAAVTRAVATAADSKADPQRRADALGLVAFAGASPHQALLEKLVDPREPDPVQAAAVRALGRIRSDAIAPFLLKNWRTMTAPVRSEAATALVTEPARARLLVDAIKKDEVQSWTLNFSQKRALIMNRDPTIRAAARPLLEEKAGEREQVLRRYEAALEKAGDAARGRQVFERVCGKCHKFQGLGAEVGPDLGTVRNRSPQMLLPDILMPNRAIAQNYETYVVETISGGSREGVLGAQTPTSITLRQEEGKEDVIRRDNIKRMYVTNLSAMPEDVEKQVDIQQMADLLEFLKTGK